MALVLTSLFGKREKDHFCHHANTESEILLTRMMMTKSIKHLDVVESENELYFCRKSEAKVNNHTADNIEYKQGFG